MEIKVGDKVRVREDAPEEFERFKGDDMNYEVVRINPSKVIIQHKLAAGVYGFTLSIPCKYLVKVEDEAKEAFCVGDWVRVCSKDAAGFGKIGKIIHVYPNDCVDINFNDGYAGGRYYGTWAIEPYTEPTEEKKEVKYHKGDRVKFKNIYELQKVKDKSYLLVKLASKEATITAVEDNGFYRVDIDPSVGGINDDMIECKVEPIATKFKVGNWVMISGVFNPQLNGMIGWISRIDKDGNKVSFQDGRFAIVEDKYLTLITQPTEQTEAEKNDSDVPFSIFRDDLLSNPQIVNLHNGMHYRQCYEADLAKEIAVKVANKFNDPEQAAEYAVSVAKAVVEGLKRK